MKIAAFHDNDTTTLVDAETDETAYEINHYDDFQSGDMEPLEAARDWCREHGHTLVEWEGEAL